MTFLSLQFSLTILSKNMRHFFAKRIPEKRDWSLSVDNLSVDNLNVDNLNDECTKVNNLSVDTKNLIRRDVESRFNFATQYIKEYTRAIFIFNANLNFVWLKN